MSSAELIAELLAMTSGLESFNNFQILNLAQSNSLFSFAPQLIEFEQSCGGELQQLLELSQSSIFNNLIEDNISLAGSLAPCLEQLLGLAQLFSSGQDNVQPVDNNNNDVNNSSNTEVSDSNSSNSTASVISSSVNNTASAANSTADANNKDNGKDQSNKDARNQDKNQDKKKNGKRGNVVQRSGASKKQVLGGLGLGLMVVVGAFAL
jgi:hypothetical protein